MNLSISKQVGVLHKKKGLSLQVCNMDLNGIPGNFSKTTNLGCGK